MCYSCMMRNKLLAEPSETALKLMGHTKSPLDRPFFPQTWTGAWMQCAINILRFLSGKQGQTQNLLATLLWWVIASTVLQYKDIRNLKHLTSEDVWVKFLDKLWGATLLIKCHSVAALKLRLKRKGSLSHCITAQRSRAVLIKQEFDCSILKVRRSFGSDKRRW